MQLGLRKFIVLMISLCYVAFTGASARAGLVDFSADSFASFGIAQPLPSGIFVVDSNIFTSTGSGNESPDAAYSFNVSTFPANHTLDQTTTTAETQVSGNATLTTSPENAQSNVFAYSGDTLTFYNSNTSDVQITVNSYLSEVLTAFSDAGIGSAITIADASTYVFQGDGSGYYLHKLSSVAYSDTYNGSDSSNMAFSYQDSVTFAAQSFTTLYAATDAGGADTISTPEPGSFVLLCTAAIGFAVNAVRQRRVKQLT